ncbi:uncharacterized protein LOC126203722 [Schistocerca nitens]|uniref:uncharacterized protein LOC126203722 n=1 Tax=Schistocerca nitens TaxID=7011 RepID=UPI0021191F99|nr:uncharacterized protein LOC126203722 [Schistocerca nitens]
MLYTADEYKPEPHIPLYHSRWLPQPEPFSFSAWPLRLWPRWRRSLLTRRHQRSLAGVPQATRSRCSQWQATELLGTRRCKTAGGYLRASIPAEQPTAASKKSESSAFF